jgi:acetyl esterase/lipase
MVQGDDRIDDGTLCVTREIPVPGSISEPARAVLRAMAPIAQQLLAHPHPMPAPDDAEGWREFVRVNDEMIIAGFEGRGISSDVRADPCDLGGIPGFDACPEGVDCGPAPVYLDIHGGGLVMGGGDACRLMTVAAAARSGLPRDGVDYRMPPDHRILHARRTASLRTAPSLSGGRPERIAVGGMSAGGNLPALLLRARQRLPMPCAVLLTPECDLTESGDTFGVLEGSTSVLVRRLREASSSTPTATTSRTYLSPLFGDVSHFPTHADPVGPRDLFLSNSVRMHRALRRGSRPTSVWRRCRTPDSATHPKRRDRAQGRRFLAKHLAPHQR